MKIGFFFYVYLKIFIVIFSAASFDKSQLEAIIKMTVSHFYENLDIASFKRCFFYLLF